MARKKNAPEPASPPLPGPEARVALGDDFDRVDALIATVDAQEAAAEAEVPPPPPKPTDPAWRDHVLGHFLPDELDADGNPKADALVRVAELLCGPIVAVEPQVVSYSCDRTNPHAAVLVAVRIAWGGDPADVRHFSDGADVHAGNLRDAAFLDFALATAVTRAKGRACKAALKLRNTYASEELRGPGPGLPPPRPLPAGPKMIEDAQRHAIAMLCRNLKIDQDALVRGSRHTRQFGSIDRVTYDAAADLLETMQGFLQGTREIPEEIKEKAK